MTTRDLLEKYPDRVDSMLVHEFKAEYLFASRSYTTLSNDAVSIFAYCHDNRRGIWINKFTHDGEVKCIQVNAGREGDDACATICLDITWLHDLADEYDTRVDISDYGSIMYPTSLDEDISDYVRKEIGTYGSSYEDKGNKIEEVLTVNPDPCFHRIRS